MGEAAGVLGGSWISPEDSGGSSPKENCICLLVVNFIFCAEVDIIPLSKNFIRQGLCFKVILSHILKFWKIWDSSAVYWVGKRFVHLQAIFAISYFCNISHFVQAKEKLEKVIQKILVENIFSLTVLDRRVLAYPQGRRRLADAPA